MAYQLNSFISGPVLLKTGRSNISLPPEIVAYVWSFLTWKDLVKFGRTSRANYRLVRSALRNTVHRLVAPFTLKGGVDRFMGMHQENPKLLNWTWAALNRPPRTFQGLFFQDQSRQVGPLILCLICLGRFLMPLIVATVYSLWVTS